MVGNGRWAGVDRKIAGELATAHGIAVVGLDSRSYFHSAQQPKGATRYLARILRYYLPAW